MASYDENLAPNDEHADETSPLLSRPSFTGFNSISPVNGKGKQTATTLAADVASDDVSAPIPTPDAAAPAAPALPAPTPVPAPAPAPAPVPVPVPAPENNTTKPPPPTRTPSPQHIAAIKADEEIVWSEPAGLRVRGQNDENLVIFRRAVGINSTLSTATDCRSLEEGRQAATGMYAACIREQRQKKLTYLLIRKFFFCLFFSILKCVCVCVNKE